MHAFNSSHAALWASQARTSDRSGRLGGYPNYPERTPVADERVPWSIEWAEYDPPN